MNDETAPNKPTRTALERAEDAIERADCYFDFGLNACATEIAVEINEAVAAERARCAEIVRARLYDEHATVILQEIKSGR